MIFLKSINKGLVAIVLTLLIGCATTRTPIILDPSFSEMKIKSIALLPIVDDRANDSYKIELGKIRNSVKNILEDKNYSVVTPTACEEVAEMRENSYVPKDCNTVIVVVNIQQCRINRNFMSCDFFMFVEGNMIRKNINGERIVLWKDKSSYSTTSGGLMGGVFQGLDRAVGKSSCLDGLFATLPKAHD